MINVSKKFSPTAATLATTSPGAATGSGISASTRSSGAPKRWQRMAFTGARSLERCRHAIPRRRWLKDKGRDSGITFFVCILWRAADGAVHSPSHCRIPQAVHAVCGFPASDCCSRHGGGPMTGMRSATALILATSLASVAFAQQQPPKPATAPQPQNTKTEPEGRKRDPSFFFVSTRPTEKVKNEVSVIIGYPFKTNSDATAEVGTAKFAMYTQDDGAWIKNVTEEARMVDAMRKGADLTVKGTSGRGTQSTDQYSLKGLAQALDKIEQECK